MKITLSFFLFVFFIPALAHADAFVTLNQVDLMMVTSCPAIKGDLKSIRIVGVKDRAQEKSVGFTKQGGEVVKVYASDLEKTIRNSVSAVLKKCGYKVGSDSDALKLTIYIDEFFGGTRNKFLVGKSTTKVALELVLETADANSQYKFRFLQEIDSKGGASKKLKRLEKSLNEALADVLNQVAASDALFNGVKELSSLQSPG